jgi:hypothetical protein
MSDNTPLAISDAESVYNAVYQMLKEFTGYPEDFTADSETIKWGSLAKEGSCIGLFPMQGAFYLNQYVSGSYVAQFPFQLAYKGKIIGKFYLDFLVDEKIVLELKQGNYFSKRNIDQVKEYLKTTELKLAILANFTSNGVKFLRVLNL